MVSSASVGFFGIWGSELRARNRQELLQQLAEVPTEVPPRKVPPGAERRTSDHRERRCIVRYLATLARDGRLSYPLVVMKLEQDREPPDFMVFYDTGANTALEVTEAGTERFQRAATALETSPPGTKLEGEDRLVPPGGELTGPGWAGDEAEREWSTVVLDHVRRKTATLAGFEHASRYHLLVYDNTHLGGLDLNEAGTILAADLADWEATSPLRGRVFSEISVLQEARLLYDVRGCRLVLSVER